MKRLRIAIAFLTRLPVPLPRAIGEEDFRGAMRWFPAVGLLVGAIVALAARGGGLVDPWMGALTGVIAWVAVTGALHLDGLADLADARGAAHRDRDRFMQVLADPHVGSFGVVAIVLQLAAKLVLLRILIEAGAILPLVPIPMAARAGVLAWQRWLPALGHGLAARFAGAVRARDLAGWAALLLAVAAFAPALLATPLLVLGWAAWLRRNVGGVTGDCHGAGIELVESGLLVATALIVRLA